MPGYGLVAETEGEGLLPWSWAADHLAAARNYFFATTRPDGRPHVMVVWGLWLHNAFYFSTGRDSRKARNLAANPACVVCPDDGEEAVLVEGTAAEVTDPAILEPFGHAYRQKYAVDVRDSPEPVYVVKPRVVYGQIEKTFTKSATRWRFD
jgi:PPOX class probable F420-dependent enzyme